LDFGDVLPGVPATINAGDGASARWFIRGTRGAEVDVTFLSLPSYLLDASNNRLSMSYGTNDAAFFTRNQPGNATTFDPVGGTRTRLHASSGRLVVWLGGTAMPTGGQVPNPYQNTITLEVTYTGN